MFFAVISEVACHAHAADTPHQITLFMFAQRRRHT
jgi:hypothetical protein